MEWIKGTPVKLKTRPDLKTINKFNRTLLILPRRVVKYATRILTGWKTDRRQTFHTCKFSNLPPTKNMVPYGEERNNKVISMNNVDQFPDFKSGVIHMLELGVRAYLSWGFWTHSKITSAVLMLNCWDCKRTKGFGSVETCSDAVKWLVIGNSKWQRHGTLSRASQHAVSIALHRKLD